MQAQANNLQIIEPTRRAEILAALIDCISSWRDVEGVKVEAANPGTIEQAPEETDVEVKGVAAQIGGQETQGESLVPAARNRTENSA